MKKMTFKKGLIFIFTFLSFVAQAQVAEDEDTNPDLSCPSSDEFRNDNTRQVDIANPSNVGTIDDRSCYADYSETNVYNKTWGVYNITNGSNHWDGTSLQPRIERSLPIARSTNIGTYVKFTGNFRILEVGDTSGTSSDGSYIAQAKGQHTGGGGSPDPAICLYLAKPVYGSGAEANQQVAFDIYAERILYRGGSGSGREIVFLKRVNKNEETNFELEVGFKADPNDANSKLHYCDAIIGGESFKFNIPEPDRATQSKIRYGAYRVKGGRAQIRWANTTHKKVEDGVVETLGNQIPMINLVGDGTINIGTGETYTDAGATAVDEEGNDITNDIVVVNPVDTTTPGTYVVTYNVSANGVAAAEVTRTVVVSDSDTGGSGSSFEWTGPAWYTIGVPGANLYMTVNTNTGDLTWENALTGNDAARQQWAIVEHRSPMSAEYIEITAEVPGAGTYTMGTVPANISGKNITLTTSVGNPVSDTTAADYGYDQFQRRKTTTSQGGNDALFIKVPGETGSRFGVAPSIAGDPVQFDGGGIDKIEFVSIREIGDPFVNTDATPVITLLGDDTVYIDEGDVYTDAGATAVDVYGNDITNDIVVVNPVDTNTPGTYTVTYNVSVNGVAAEEVTRTVVVNPFDSRYLGYSGEWTTNGSYKINVPGENLFMTVNSSTGALEWATELPGNDQTQVWTIKDHIVPMGTGYMQITAEIDGFGVLSMGTVPANISGKNITLTVNLNEPVADVTAVDYGYDQFQRRKTTTNNGGNDALFIKVPGEGGSRFGVSPAVAGDPVQFDGGGIDKLVFTLIEAIEDEVLSVLDKQASTISTATANDNLVISGLTTEVNRVTIYSLLGRVFISESFEGNATQVTLNISSLSSGIYMVKLDGAGGTFFKKIIKQ